MFDNRLDLEKDLQKHYMYLRHDVDELFVTNLADLHVGHKGFDEKSMVNSVNYIAKIPNFQVFLGGDSVNHANKGSKSSQYEEDMDTREQFFGQFDQNGRLKKKGLKQLLEPIKDKIAFKIDGNHDGTRAKEFNGISPSEWFCSEFGIPYLGELALVQLSVGKNAYTSYHHHISGSTGKKLNLGKLEELGSLWWFDMLFGEHTHRNTQGWKPITYIDEKHKKVRIRKQYYINSNSMLGWSGYAREKNYGIGLTGLKVVRLSGKKGDHAIQVFDTFKEFVEYYENRK